MNYKEAVERKITGEANELSRCRELWRKIVIAYEHGGEDAIKSVLIERSKSLTREFDKLLNQLRKRL
ncbi:MAG: hypothetical protein ACE5K4_12155 [Candidatus Hydrothermarchaeota archaeon]